MTQSKHANITCPLLYAASSEDADALYFGGVSVPDPFIAFGGPDGLKVAVLNALEFARVKRRSDFDEVLAQEDLQEAARVRYSVERAGPAEMICLLAERFHVAEFTIPEKFPAGLARKLERLGLHLKIAEGPLFPERLIKSAREARAIAAGNACSAAGIAAAAALLRASKIRAGNLHLGGQPLTSERLKFEIEVACLAAGGVSRDTIAAGGDQACDPHERGSGPLRANELIIVDVFPRMSATGYHGDMTRTFVRGRASDAQRNIVGAVRDAQLAALGRIRAGVNGRDVHQACNDVFAARGFETKRTPRGSVGFFHGTGHGLGLDIHEAPRVSTVDNTLEAGTVVTIEPGLYYPGVGACRIEDVVQVTRARPKLLSDAPYEWEFR